MLEWKATVILKRKKKTKTKTKNGNKIQTTDDQSNVFGDRFYHLLQFSNNNQLYLKEGYDKQ